MAPRLFRAGKFDEHERRLFADSACYLTLDARRTVTFNCLPRRTNLGERTTHAT